MASRASKKIVYAAIVSNVAIALCKYVTAAFTGSSSMLAEAFHSTVDTGNEVLLLVGLKRSGRPPSAFHPFGHGKALLFHSLVIAVNIFSSVRAVVMMLVNVCESLIFAFWYTEPANALGPPELL